MLLDPFAAVLVHEFSRKRMRLILCEMASLRLSKWFCFSSASLIAATRSNVFCKFKLQDVYVQVMVNKQNRTTAKACAMNCCVLQQYLKQN